METAEKAKRRSEADSEKWMKRRRKGEGKKRR